MLVSAITLDSDVPVISQSEHILSCIDGTLESFRKASGLTVVASNRRCSDLPVGLKVCRFRDFESKLLIEGS
jgi:hypothetical protein